jgi:hypothetical protein
VIVQIAIPASYYLRADRDDERFAWRMFSAVRVKKCEVRLQEERRDGASRSVPLKQAFHSAWVHALERGRQRVIDEVLKARCAQPSMAEARIERSCQDAARRPLPPQLFRMQCDEGRTLREAPP